MIISIVKALLIASVPTLLSVSNAAPNEEQSTGPLSAVHAFHAALAHGDAKAALALLAQDAVVLEAGSAQTRDEYAGEHLGEDIAFAKAVQTTRTKEGCSSRGQSCVGNRNHTRARQSQRSQDRQQWRRANRADETRR